MTQQRNAPAEGGGSGTPSLTTPLFENVSPKEEPGGGNFEDLTLARHGFSDDVHGRIQLTQLERDCIDSPEFQRLFRISQLGFVDLVFATANHTRGMHSIGTCHVASTLFQTLVDSSRGAPDLIRPSEPERVLVRLGALLHDISHGPYSHDIERKAHHIYLDPGAPDKVTRVKSYYGPYEKHDDFEANPALFVALLDPSSSVLARILQNYSSRYWELLRAQRPSHLLDFIEIAGRKWPRVADEILPSLLFHLLAHERPDRALSMSAPLLVCRRFGGEPDDWGLGPPDAWQELHLAWYQPFRHDVIGNTFSADLVDYLRRDTRRLGTRGQVDLHLLRYYGLTPYVAPNIPEGRKYYRCALDILDKKRGTIRAETVNDIFRLLDLRHEIHEKAVFHRLVQAAIAMLSRSCLILRDRKPKPATLYRFETTDVSTTGDDSFLSALISASRPPTGDNPRSLPHKLAERRLYRPLIVIPGDRVERLLQGICTLSEGREATLRELAVLVDSPAFAPFFLAVSWLIEKQLNHALPASRLGDYLDDLRQGTPRGLRILGQIPSRVIFWILPYKQLYKDPALVVCAGGDALTLEEWAGVRDAPGRLAGLQERVRAGVRDSHAKYASMWKLYLFLSDSLFFSGIVPKILVGLGSKHACADNYRNHRLCLKQAREFAVRSLRASWEFWEHRKRGLTATELGDSLREPVEGEDLRRLFSYLGDAYLADFSESVADDVSTVDLDAQLHGPTAQMRCHDIRYKYDRPGQPQLKPWFGELLKAGSYRPEQFGAEELDDLQTRLAPYSTELTGLYTSSPQRDARNIDALLDILMDLRA